MGRITKDDRCLIKGLYEQRKMGAKRLIKEFPYNTTTSLEYFLLGLNITVTFVVADGPLT